MAAVEERFGGLDALVSNAGLFLAGGGDGPSPQLAEENWQRTIDVNLKSVYLGAKYAIPALQRRGGGSIVNVGVGGGAAGRLRHVRRVHGVEGRRGGDHAHAGGGARAPRSA